MADQIPSPGSSLPALAVGLLLAIGAGAAAYTLHTQGRRLAELSEAAAKNDAKIEELYGEVVRMRIEQKSDKLGPLALLEKLKTFAPLLTNSRTTEPDFRAAQKEMDSVLRAFAVMGPRAWDPIIDRLKEVKCEESFDEIKWLLEAAERVDKSKTTAIAKNLLLGLAMPGSSMVPTPRLRWYAASMLIDYDLPLAQATLRQVLLTESSRGINMERAQIYNAVIPDQAAYATTGFHNFVLWYIRSGDPKTEETLLMVLGRSEHDLMTIQTCVEELGKRRCAPAVDPIVQLCQHPPGNVDNPIFMNTCFDALDAIQGTRARPFFEAMLEKVASPLEQDHLKNLLKKE